MPNDVLDTPAVVAHARLVVIGGDSHRLHEEIITAGGFIKEDRWVARLNVGEVETALAGGDGRRAVGAGAGQAARTLRRTRPVAGLRRWKPA